MINMEECKPIGTLFETNLKLMKLIDEDFVEVEDQMKDLSYKAIIGSFIYAMISTRMDLTYVVSIMSQYIT